MNKFLCKNYGSCAKADSREAIELAPGSEPLCECGFKLELAEVAGVSSGRKGKLLAAGIGLVVALGSFAAYWLSRATPSATVAARPVPASAPPPASTASGVAPDALALASAKQGVDAALKNSTGTSAAATGQRNVIAREYVKAAIAPMQAGNWAQAQVQLDKAKAENADEPLIYINEAIIQLKQGQPQKAMALIEVSMQKGFRDFAALEADLDLKPLTVEGTYKAMATRYAVK
jgi:hypothetical protein